MVDEYNQLLLNMQRVPDLKPLLPAHFNRHVGPTQENNYDSPETLCPQCQRVMELEEIFTTVIGHELHARHLFPVPITGTIERKDFWYSCVHGQSFKKWVDEPLTRTMWSAVHLKTTNSNNEKDTVTYSLLYKLY